MQTYVVRRADVAATAAELDAALARLRAFEEQPRALAARWMHSYALRQADGRFGLACVFQADRAETLERHAALTRLAAQEILPVAMTLPTRPFAPTLVYLIRRRSFSLSAADLEHSAAAARRVADEEMPREVSPLHSYGIDEGDGRLGTVCLYQAARPAALRGHAARVGIPADEITPVIGRIVFRREEPKPRAAADTALSA